MLRKPEISAGLIGLLARKQRLKEDIGFKIQGEFFISGGSVFLRPLACTDFVIQDAAVHLTAVMK